MSRSNTPHVKHAVLSNEYPKAINLGHFEYQGSRPIIVDTKELSSLHKQYATIDTIFLLYRVGSKVCICANTHKNKIELNAKGYTKQSVSPLDTPALHCLSTYLNDTSGFYKIKPCLKSKVSKLRHEYDETQRQQQKDNTVFLNHVISHAPCLLLFVGLANISRAIENHQRMKKRALRHAR